MHYNDSRPAQRSGPRAREDPIGRRSAVNLDSVESVSVAVLVERIGVLSGARMRELCAALAVATDCE